MSLYSILPLPLTQIHRYKIGEAFLHLTLPRALKRLEQDQSDIDHQVAKLSSSADECTSEMKELKTILYGKFGRAINLDE